jgi:hypothetical protein
MRAKLLTRIVATLAIFPLAGCFPSFLTSRPEAEIIVTDESGQPLEGAKVTLGTTERHGPGGRLTQEDFLTDVKGRVEFDAKYTWKTQVMLPDGDVSYGWTLCFSKPGFEAIPMMRINFDEPIEVAMYPSAVPSECEWRQNEYVARVKEREARWIEVEGGEWQSNMGITMLMDEQIRAAMSASARAQGIKLRSWSEYRFQFQARGNGLRNTRLFVHAICRAPADFDLTRKFYSEPDASGCFFDTTYFNQSYTDQPKSYFEPLRIVADKG